MAYNNFGGSTADVSTDVAGNVIGNQTFQVWTAKTGGTQITDTKDVAGTATAGVVKSATGPLATDVGRIQFQAPDTYSVVYLDPGTGSRWPIVSQESLAKIPTAVSQASSAISTANTANATANSAKTTAAAADKRSIDAMAEIDARLPSAGIFVNDVRMKTFFSQASRVEAGMAGRLNVAVVADSIGEGATASREELKWLALFKDHLQKAYMGVTGGRGFIPAIHGFTNLPDVFTFTGSPTIDRSNNNPDGFGRRAITLASGQTATITTFGDRVGVMYTGRAGAITVTIDGAASTIPAATGTNIGLTGQLWTSAALTYGPHTVVIAPASTTAITLDGVVEWDKDYDRGVTMWEGAHNAAKADNFDGVLTNSARWSDALTTIGPHLVLIALGTNDSRQADKTLYNADTFATRMKRIVDLVRSKTAATAPTIGFVLPPTPGSGSADYPAYLQEVIDVANDNNVAIFNISNRVPSGPLTGTSALYADTLHPNDAGHALWADSVSAAILPARHSSASGGQRFFIRNTGWSTNNINYENPTIGRIACRVKVGPSGKLKVTMSTRIKVTPTASGVTVLANVALSGANVVAVAAGSGGIYLDTGTTTTPILTLTSVDFFEGLTPGDTWVDVQNRVSVATSTGTFDDFRLVVEPL